MSTHATGTVDMKSWAEQTWDGKPHNEVSGAKQTAVSMTAAFRGDLDALGDTRFLMVYTDDDNCDYVGYEIVTGTLGDRTGAFALRHIGGYHDGVPKAALTVVADSGTGALVGLRGTGGIVWANGKPGTYTLDYHFES